MRKTVDGNTTNYSIDIAAGLTQVLADDEHTYLYGVGRIAQHSAASTDYFGFASQSFTDALGSVRQLADAEGEVSLARSFKPYGETLSSSGEGATSYGFAGEWTDASGLVFLRARYYAPWHGRLISRDPSQLGANLYTYANANPINYTDPIGLFSINEIVFSLGGWNYSNYISKFLDIIESSGLYGREYGSPKWGLFASLLDANPGDRLESYRLKLDVNVPPSLEKVANAKLDYSASFGVYDRVITAGGLPLNQFVFNNILYSGLSWHGITPVTSRGYDARYYLLHSSIYGNRAYIDGSKYTDYPDFIFEGIGVIDVLKLSIDPTNFFKDICKDPVKMGPSATFAYIVDRFGNRYLSGSLNIGVGFSLGEVGEGYVIPDASQAFSRRPSSIIPNSEELQRAIQGLTFGFSGAIFQGGGFSTEVWLGGPGKPGVLFFTSGLHVGASGDITYTRSLNNPDANLGWDWAIQAEAGGFGMAVFRNDIVARIR